MGLARMRVTQAGVDTIERILPTDRHRLTVVTYHRIGEPGENPDLYPGLLSATPSGFADQMAYLSARRRILSAEELLAVRAGSATLPPDSVVVTFDDAYQDFAERAAPILRDKGVPAILFVPTDYPGGEIGFWWDRLWAAFRRLPLPSGTPGDRAEILRTPSDVHRMFRRLVQELKSAPRQAAIDRLEGLLGQLPDPGPCHAVVSWSQLSDLAAQDGLTIAPHSRSHPRLDHTEPELLSSEIEGSRQDLADSLGANPLPVFAYPDGGLDDRVVRAVEAAGISIAFSTRRGTNDVRRIDWLRVRRINIGVQASLALIRAQMLLPPWATGPGPRRVA
jgi:peptidoglycan/xylan/chitin deacetylase (PgdA/CDA1 family)